MDSNLTETDLDNESAPPLTESGESDGFLSTGGIDDFEEDDNEDHDPSFVQDNDQASDDDGFNVEMIDEEPRGHQRKKVSILSKSDIMLLTAIPQVLPAVRGALRAAINAE